MLATIGILLIVVAGLYARHRTQTLTGPAAEFQEMLLVEQEVVGIYDQAKTGFEEGKIDAQTFADIIKSEVLVPWREAEVRFRKVDTDKLTEKGKGRYQRLLQLMKLREQAWGLIVDSLREGSDEGMAAAAQKSAQADRIEDEIAAEYESSQEDGPNDGTQRKRGRQPDET